MKLILRAKHSCPYISFYLTILLTIVTYITNKEAK